MDYAFFPSLLCYAPILFKSPYFLLCFVVLPNFVHFLKWQNTLINDRWWFNQTFLKHGPSKSLCWDAVIFSFLVVSCCYRIESSKIRKITLKYHLFNYAGIMLDASAYLLCSKLCQHNPHRSTRWHSWSIIGLIGA